MGGRSPESAEPIPLPPLLAPSLLESAAIFFLVLLVLLANGRPIGAGDTRPTERVAASLVESFDFDLDEYPEVTAPFVRRVGEHSVSIYPVLSAVLAAPVFAACRVFFALDETGTALAGKLAAAILSSLAAVFFFRALARRVPIAEARAAALLLALGTSVWSTSQALWQHPAAVLFLSLALWCIFRAEDDDAWAARAGLPLALVVAARHADVALVAALAIGIAVRWPRRMPGFFAWALGPLLFVAGYQLRYFGAPWTTGFSGSLASRFSESLSVGVPGLLVSPAKGLFVFTPLALVAVVGLFRVLQRGERWLPIVAASACLAHLLLIGSWSEWHGGESFGPRMTTDLLPILFVFLPAGCEALPRVAAVLAALSIGVQALGAFTYDYRWERLYQRPPAPDHRELWSVADSPIALALRERVITLAAPGIAEQRAFVSEYPIAPFGASGSRVTFPAGVLRSDGSENAFDNVLLQRGARIVDDRLRLRGRFDALFLRVREGARPRHLQLRVSGRGQGVLYVGERTFGKPKTRWTEYPMNGAFSIRHAYFFAESGGGDVLVALGKEAGDASLESVALVSPREPENVIRLP
jgi:hypothetical protein